MTIGQQREQEIPRSVCSLPGGHQKLLDLGIGQKVFHATIYSQCFHTLYITEASGRRKARENVGDFAGLLPDSSQNALFVKNSSKFF